MTENGRSFDSIEGIEQKNEDIEFTLDKMEERIRKIDGIICELRENIRKSAAVISAMKAECSPDDEEKIREIREQEEQLKNDRKILNETIKEQHNTKKFFYRQKQFLHSSKKKLTQLYPKTKTLSAFSCTESRYCRNIILNSALRIPNLSIRAENKS